MRAQSLRILLLGLAAAALTTGPRPAAAQEMDIRIVLETLTARSLDDGIADTTVEAYGFINVAGHQPLVRVHWNRHACEHGCILASRPPYTTRIPDGATRTWANMFLSIGSPGTPRPAPSFRQDNNVITIRRIGPKQIGAPLTVSFKFLDHDDGSGDDIWCDTSSASELSIPAGRTMADWLGAGEEHHTLSARGPDGRCTVTLTVSAIRR